MVTCDTNRSPATLPDALRGSTSVSLAGNYWGTLLRMGCPEQRLRGAGWRGSQGNCLETGIGSCLAGGQRPANSELLEVNATMDSTCPQGEVGPPQLSTSATYVVRAIGAVHRLWAGLTNPEWGMLGGGDRQWQKGWV